MGLQIDVEMRTTKQFIRNYSAQAKETLNLFCTYQVSNSLENIL